MSKRISLLPYLLVGAVVAVVLVGVVGSRVSAAPHAPGDLDPSFGSAGKVVTDWSAGGDDHIEAMVVLTSGKILVAGSIGATGKRDFALARYNANGTIDTTFGSAGRVATDFDQGDDVAHALAVQDDGKIIVAGGVTTGTTVPTLDFGVARYSANGALDATFHGDGKTSIAFTANNIPDEATAVVIDANGLIVVGGYTNGGNSANFALARFKSDGALDTTFGGGANGPAPGKVVTDIAGRADGLNALALTPSDLGPQKIYAAGYSTPASGPTDFALARYADNGALDPGFANTGNVTLDFAANADVAHAMVLQSDGNIVLAGETLSGSYDFALARLTSGGSPDSSFGTGGKVTLDFAASGDKVLALTIQPADGKIVAAGLAYSRSDGKLSDQFALARFSSAGLLDSTFGAAGKVLTDWSGGEDHANAVAIQSNGLILAAGYTDAYLGKDFALARYLNSGPAATATPTNTLTPMPLPPDGGNGDPAFGSHGQVVTDWSAGGDDVLRAMTVLADGKILAAGYAGPPSKHHFALARYNANGTLDTTFGSGGKTSISFGGDDERALAMAVYTPTGRIALSGFTSQGSVSKVAVAVFKLSNGAVDNTFGAGGRFTFLYYVNRTQSGQAIAFQGDGKIIVGGAASQSNADFALARLTTGGALDSSFGGGAYGPAPGQVVTDFSGGFDDIYELLVQPDGRIIAVGATAAGNYNFGAARYNTTGQLDTTFGRGGKVAVDFAAADDEAHSAALQSDGKIVLGGSVGIEGLTHFGLARLNSNGTLDTAFGGDGRIDTLFAGASSYAEAVALQSDGKIIAAGYANTRINGRLSDNFALARFAANGALDSTFYGNGRVASDFDTGNDHAYAVAVQTDGKIVAAGVSTAHLGNDFVLLRYIAPNAAASATPTATLPPTPAPPASGALDNTFSGDGKQTTDFGGADDQARAIAIDAVRSKFVVVGYSGAAGNHDFAVARYSLSNGALDPTFASGGKLSTDFNGRDDKAYAVAIQSDGKILVAGSATYISPTTSLNFAIARYNLNGSLDTTFGTGGKVNFFFNAGDNRDDIAYAIAVDSATGKIVVGGATYIDYTDFALARLNADGSLDTSFDGDGKLTTDFSDYHDSINALTLLPFGAILVAGYTDSTNMNFAAALYNSNGTLRPGFGNGGKVAIDFNATADVANALLVQSDGKFVLAGRTAGSTIDFALARLNADGTLDPTFGSGGRVVTDVAGSNDELWSLAQGANGTIVAAGAVFSRLGTLSDNFGVTRYKANGTLDPSFQDGGKGIADFTGTEDRAHGGAVQSDGKVLAVGYSKPTSGNADWALARFAATGGGTAGPVAGPIFAGPGEQEAPRIDGNLVVWQDNHGGTWDIRARDLVRRTTFTVHSGPGDQTNPVISGDLVVWQDNRNGNWDIYAARVSTATAGTSFAVFTGAGDQTYPSVSGNRVAWQSDGGSAGRRWDVFALTLGGQPAKLNANNTTTNEHAAVSGNNAVWQTTTATQTVASPLGVKAASWDIVGINLASSTRFDVATTANDEILPDIDGTFVVWQELTADEADQPFPRQRWVGKGTDIANPSSVKVSQGNGGNHASSVIVSHGNGDNIFNRTSSGKVAYENDPLPGTLRPNAATSNIQVSDVSAGTVTTASLASREAGVPDISSGTVVWEQLSTEGDSDIWGNVCAASFGDVSTGDFFYEPVQWLSCGGAISGYGDGTFRPFQNTTRGQLAKIIVAAEGWSIDTTGGPHFVDVPATNPFYGFVETAFQRGIISGYDLPGGGKEFRWGANVTRGQLAKIIVGAQGWTSDTTGGPHFADVSATNPFYAQIETAYNRGIISGYDLPGGGKEFRWGANATRGQIAKIAYLALAQ